MAARKKRWLAEPLVWLSAWGLAVIVALLLVFARQGRTATSADVAPAVSCRPNPLANVYNPRRLKVLHPCMTVAGVVDYVQHQDDGDYHIVLRVDSAFRSYLNGGNIFGESVLEIVPADQPGCIPGQPAPISSDEMDLGICTGASVATPDLGRHIAATGPHVLDMEHGWMEIHPVWGWRYLDSSRSRLPVAAIARHFLPNE